MTPVVSFNPESIKSNLRPPQTDDDSTREVAETFSFTPMNKVVEVTRPPLFFIETLIIIVFAVGVVVSGQREGFPSYLLIHRDIRSVILICFFSTLTTTPKWGQDGYKELSFPSTLRLLF